MPRQTAGLQISGRANQFLAEIEFRVIAIEVLKGMRQQGWNDETLLGVAVGIAEEKAGAIFQRRRHEIQIQSQTGQRLSHRVHHTDEQAEVNPASRTWRTFLARALAEKGFWMKPAFWLLKPYCCMVSSV